MIAIARLQRLFPRRVQCRLNRRQERFGHPLKTEVGGMRAIDRRLANMDRSDWADMLRQGAPSNIGAWFGFGIGDHRGRPGTYGTC